MGMTQGMRKAIDEAKQSATGTHPARIGPWVHENVFWALKIAGYVNDSGWLTSKAMTA